MRAFLGGAWDIVLRGGAALFALYGGARGDLTALCALMALDYLTGVLRAALGKSDKSGGGGLSAAAGFRGILRKGLMLLVVLIAALLDTVAGESGLLRGAVVWFYLCNEGISVLENVTALGVPVPGVVRAALSGRQGGQSSTLSSR